MPDPRLDALMSEFESGRVPLLQFIRSAKDILDSMDGELPIVGKAYVGSFGNHTEGRDLMACLLRISGFETVVADRHVNVESMIKSCSDDPDIDVLCLSVQTTYDCPSLYDLEELLMEAGIRDRLIVNVGGAAINEFLADKMGSDVFSRSAVESTKLIKEKVIERRGLKGV